MKKSKLVSLQKVNDFNSGLTVNEVIEQVNPSNEQDDQPIEQVDQPIEKSEPISKNESELTQTVELSELKQQNEGFVNTLQAMQTTIEEIKAENQRLTNELQKRKSMSVDEMIRFSMKKTELIKKREVFLKKKESLQGIEIDEKDDLENSERLKIQLVKVSQYNDKNDQAYFSISNVCIIKDLVLYINQLIDHKLHSIESEIQEIYC